MDVVRHLNDTCFVEVMAPDASRYLTAIITASCAMVVSKNVECRFK